MQKMYKNGFKINQQIQKARGPTHTKPKPTFLWCFFTLANNTI